MTGIRKKISLILAAILLLLCIFSLTSCKENENGAEYMIYYTNAERNDIIYRTTSISGEENMESTELTAYLLDLMFNPTRGNDEYFSTLPDDVRIKEYTIDGSLITFDFSEGYKELSNVDEILLRAAVVLTIIQQPGISQVAFTVEGEPLTDSYGKTIGNMSASNFVNILLTEEGMLKQETDLTIYFTDESGTKLIPAMYHFTIRNSNTSMEEYILQQLKAGPAIESTYRTMAADVEILGIVTSDGVCYVNFGSNFLEQEQPASDDILIYSIVNSLCMLPYVSSVQFLIDGNNNAVLHTVTDLSVPFRRNRDLEQ